MLVYFGRRQAAGRAGNSVKLYHVWATDIAYARSSRSTAEAGSTNAPSMELAIQDYQLNEALTLLKGLHILSKQTPPQG